MPIYNDNRMNLLFPENRDFIIASFEETLSENHIQYDIIAGTSTAGIPWASMLGYKEEKPVIYVRDKPKDHGMKNRIEGIDAERDLSGARVVLIEDLVSTGGSSVSAVQGIRDAKGEIDTCLSIFSYDLDQAMEMFGGSREFDKQTGARLDSPCVLLPSLNYETLLEVARKECYADNSQLELLREWRADPFGWGERYGHPHVKKQER